MKSAVFNYQARIEKTEKMGIKKAVAEEDEPGDESDDDSPTPNLKVSKL